ncbi:inositol monophosphatase family protein [Zafaria sp. Z1313]|uniref:inositol monophosphatase family protein n=1 Tax=unclassified Zafaria TaxID=2828765 RepID=UPI002E781EB8|nr:inositol monophosphatase family protein [Zafaria sp. J156]MEE1620008.1 inositol monophosphatase family protein [Zafaria sp. J156]
MSAEPTPAGLLAVAREAAAAGAAVLAGRPSGAIRVDTKSAAGDWVTDFDRRAEDAVRAVLRAARPDDEITGEEYGTTVPERPSGYRWSIDPLDGTTNFVRGIVYYATSVAVSGPTPDGRRWLAGAVHAPALGQEFYAGRGLGAWVREDAGERRLTGPDPDSDAPLLGTGFGYDAGRRAFQLEALGALLPGYANVRRIGSAALDLCLVADGVLDAYAEYGTHVHDWSAGALIAEEAGAAVVRPATTPGWSVAGRVDPAALPEPDGR